MIPPLGLMYLASYLRENGHVVTIIDVAKTRQNNSLTVKDLKEFIPDLIGIGGIITAYKFISVLIKDLKKEFTNTPFVIGGHVTLDNAQLLLCNFGFDYVIEGYGEKKMLYLIEYLNEERNIDDVAGLSYLKEGKVVTVPGDLFFKHIDDCPFPAYDLVDMEYYTTCNPDSKELTHYLKQTRKPKPMMRSFTVIGTRGCTAKCSFCVHEFGGFKGFHIHSVDYIIRNIRVLYEKYGVRVFNVGGEHFLYNFRFASLFVGQMNKFFPDVYFFTITRADCITSKLINLLGGSNCFCLNFGFESGSNKILKVLNKRLTRDINIDAYKLICSSNIVPSVTCMVGSPGETYTTIKDTIDAFKDAGITSCGMFYTTPYPGSRLFRWCMEQGYIKDKNSYLKSVSDSNASILRFNFTPYPNAIVHMMMLLLKGAMQKNKDHVDVSVGEFLRLFFIYPLMFESYFLFRKLLSCLVSKYENDIIDCMVDSESTLILSNDKGDTHKQN